jgi:curved DNA-binding protein CbpA
MYEGMEEGPNHYQLLGVTRYDGIAVTKRAYRTLSLEIHPDKNKAPTATEDFQRVKQAFDILVDKDKRREYNRLGEAGVHAASQLVVDHRYLLVQLAVYYGSSLVLAFIMTISEPTGEAFSLSLFGLAGT